MPDVHIVNPVDEAEIEPWLRGLLRGLLSNPYEHAAERVAQTRRSWQPDRAWGARDGDQWVASLLSLQRRLTVPGGPEATGDIAVDAVSGVTVAATHRRRGLLSRMLADALRAAKERGDAVSALIPAEYPIYGRFGYAPAAWTARYLFLPREPGSQPVGGDRSAVRHVEAADLRDTASAVFAAARRMRAGQLDRPFPWWERALGLDGHGSAGDIPKNWAVHEGADGADGLVAWRATRSFDLAAPAGAAKVTDLVAANDTAYRDLWAYVAGIDLLTEIELFERPVDEPVRWLLPNARALRSTSVTDFLWLRLLDVPAALTARGYAGAGGLVLDVVDDAVGGYGHGRFALRAEGGSAECSPTSASADLRLSQRALASCYLGGATLRQQWLAGAVEELTTGALARFDALFATAQAPWNATWF